MYIWFQQVFQFHISLLMLSMVLSILIYFHICYASDSLKLFEINQLQPPKPSITPPKPSIKISLKISLKFLMFFICSSYSFYFVCPICSIVYLPLISAISLKRKHFYCFSPMIHLHIPVLSSFFLLVQPVSMS